MLVSQDTQENNGVWECPDKDPHKYLISNKGAKAFKCRKNSLLNKWCWKNKASIFLWMNFKCLFCTIHKNKIRVDHRPKIIKPLEENVWENLCDLRLEKDFLNKIPIAQSAKGKENNKSTSSKLRISILWRHC